MITQALISINTATLGKPLLLTLWDGDRPDERTTIPLDSKAEAISHVRKVERGQRSRVTVEATV